MALKLDTQDYSTEIVEAVAQSLGDELNTSLDAREIFKNLMGAYGKYFNSTTWSVLGSSFTELVTTARVECGKLATDQGARDQILHQLVADFFQEQSGFFAALDALMTGTIESTDMLRAIAALARRKGTPESILMELGIAEGMGTRLEPGIDNPNGLKLPVANTFQTPAVPQNGEYRARLQTELYAAHGLSLKNPDVHSSTRAVRDKIKQALASGEEKKD